MKKIISILMAFILLIGCFSVSVSAKGNIVVMGQMRSKRLHGASATYHKQTAEKVLSKYVDLSVLESLTMSGVSDCVESVDVSVYNIPISALNTITDYFFYAVPEAFNINQMGCSYYDSTNTIADIIITYNSFADTAVEYDSCISKMSSASGEILSGIKGNNKLNDEQKLLLIHDRLAVWNTYGYPENTTEIEAHTAFGALGNKMSVCQGYAMAYMYLLDQVGIASYYCSSENLCHGWNIVFLNGKKYHVDVTWDDTDFRGEVRHDNFLRSSNGIFETGHDKYDYDTTPTDTKYDNYFWQNSYAEFQLLNNEIYYIDHSTHELKRLSDNKALCEVQNIYSTLANDGRSLFYSSETAVYRFDLGTNKSEVVYWPTLAYDEILVGMEYWLDAFHCQIYNYDTSEYRYIEQPYKYDYSLNSTHGDANGDGQINTRDAALVMQYANGWSVNIDTINADVNGDSNVNARDYALIMQYANGWEVILGPKA